jgi:hypothetical protein
MAYRVTAPYVTAEVQGVPGGAATTLGFYEGALLPGNVVQASAERLVAKGMAEKVSAPAPEPEAEAEPEAPAGSAAPRKNASRDAWVTYAVSKRDADTSEEDARAAAEAMSHAELVAAYSG